LALALAGLVLAACAGAGRRGLPVATARVDLPRSYRYVPAQITVPVGTTVTWRNSDVFTHSVRLRDLADTNLIMKPGDSASYTFTTPGLHRYDCAFHTQMMTGSVEVTAAR
jgi:plastocyanin